MCSLFLVSFSLFTTILSAIIIHFLLRVSCFFRNLLTFSLFYNLLFISCFLFFYFLLFFLCNCLSTITFLAIYFLFLSKFINFYLGHIKQKNQIRTMVKIRNFIKHWQPFDFFKNLYVFKLYKKRLQNTHWI